MVISALLLCFAISSVVACGVIIAMTAPLDRILRHVTHDDIARAWARYIKFAAFVAGISGGVQIYALERYVQEGAAKSSDAIPLTLERWIIEGYRTIIETLQSTAWLYMVVFVVVFLAYAVIRAGEVRRKRETPANQSEEKGAAQ